MATMTKVEDGSGRRSRQRLGRLGAQLVAAAGGAGPVLEPPWDLPPPKDLPAQLEKLAGPVENYKVPVRTVVSEDYQREYLLRSGVPESAFRGSLDPAFLSAGATGAQGLATVPRPKDPSKEKKQRSASGGAHVSDRMTLLGPPLRCGEPLTYTFGTGSSEPHPKGTMSKTEVSVTNANGEKVMHLQRAGLTLDPVLVASAKKAASAAGGAAEAAKAEDPKAGKSFVSAVQFTPDMCAGYCYFVPNRIHNEMTTANEFGFKEPILAGTQCMHILTAHVYQSFGVPRTMTAEFHFARPVFWTDRIELWVSADLAARKGVGDYVLLNRDGKVVTSMVVEELSF